MLALGLGFGLRSDRSGTSTPANAIYDRAASPIADRAGSIIVTR